MKPRTAPILLLAVLAAGGLSAQVPAGGEFRVNSHTTGQQMAPAAASDAAGNFVVAWQSIFVVGLPWDVALQRYDASGAPLGSELRVNVFTADSQAKPAISSDPAGNFVVTWSGYGAGVAGVLAQRFDRSGNRRGSEFLVSASTPTVNLYSSVASDVSGGFVIVWASYDSDGVFGQRFDGSGARRGAEFQVSQYTTGPQRLPSVASDAAGNFVVTWTSDLGDGSGSGVFARRYDASGLPFGPEFRVNTETLLFQGFSKVAAGPAGDFVVVWHSEDQDGSRFGLFGQRYDSSGAPLGSEFRVNTYTTGQQSAPAVAVDASGAFVIAWTSGIQFGGVESTFAQRYDASGAPRGSEFQVNTYVTSSVIPSRPSMATDAVGNFFVTWWNDGQDGSSSGIFGQRFGGLQPAALGVDSTPSSGADGNRVFEPGETAVAVAPSWRNANGTAQTFDGLGLSFTGPAASGVSYLLTDAVGSYGTVANGATALCSDCYQVGVGFGGGRPATHWDATFTERLTPDAFGQTKPWALHLGESFTDVPKTSPFYRFIETLLHKGVSGGCSPTTYCPGDPVTREQVAVFTLAGKEGPSYSPPGCTAPVFGDVPATSPFCRFVEELARRGVVSGCGGGNFCPASPVTREQMAVFLLVTLDPAISPPPCVPPNLFNDVPETSPFCRWVEELAQRGVTGGCGGGNYCPASPVTREQMAVFICVTFGLNLYGP